MPEQLQYTEEELINTMKEAASRFDDEAENFDYIGVETQKHKDNLRRFAGILLAEVDRIASKNT